MMLPYLVTVTLEVIEKNEAAELIGKLPLLHRSGKLLGRTCEEAQRIALEARQNPAYYSEDHTIVSPLWSSEKVSACAMAWYAGLSILVMI